MKEKQVNNKRTYINQYISSSAIIIFLFLTANMT